MKYSLLTIAAGILWGVISLFLKPLNSAGFSSLQIMFFRGLLSSFFLFIFLFIKDKKLLKISLKDLWMFIGTGIVSLTFFSLCYFKTILESGASIAVILLYTSPIFVLFMSLILFKEKITLKKILALIMTFLGCIFVTEIIGGNHSLTLKGFLIGLCAGFGYALYSIFSRYTLKKYNSLTVTFYTFVFSSLSIMPFCSIKTVSNCFNQKVIFLIIGIALICTVLPYIFYTFGLSGLETGKAAILVTVEPLVGTIVGFCVWKESISILKIIGILLIFSSVILLGTEKQSDIKSEEKSL
ncbi:MAG: DMT family transporter [Treponema sp.]|nr:DMT family transporter [Treponema sp.]